MFEVEPLLIPRSDFGPHGEFLHRPDLATIFDDDSPDHRIPAALHRTPQQPGSHHQVDATEAGEADVAAVVEVKVEIHVRRPDARANHRLAIERGARPQKISNDDDQKPKQQDHQFRSNSRISPLPSMSSVRSSSIAAPSPARSMSPLRSTAPRATCNQP